MHWKTIAVDDSSVAASIPQADQLHLWWQPLDAEPLRSPPSPAGWPTSTRTIQRRIVADHWLRLILARYLNRDPAQLQFDRQPRGRPHCIDTPAGFDFNLSHSADRLLIAVAAQPIGVDLESTRRKRSIETLAREVLHADERAWIKRQPQHRQMEAFLRLWVAKEALLKAHGLGVWDGIGKIRLTGLGGPILDYAAWPAAIGDGAGWAALELTPAVGFRAAIAAARLPHRASIMAWQLVPVGSRSA